MRLIEIATGTMVTTTEAGGERLIARGSHKPYEEPAAPTSAPKRTAKREA